MDIHVVTYSLFRRKSGLDTDVADVSPQWILR
jgi:hypothetical protein